MLMGLLCVVMPQGERVFLNIRTLCFLNKSCVFDVFMVEALEAQFQGLIEID